jgi:RsiW-degrading membrane proteinase PrsW (M82 family)
MQLIVARLTNSHLTKDWRAMLVYGVCAGAGFATLENLMYVAQFGLATGIVRGFVSVPLHCTTGAIIGLNLANKRPIEVGGDGGVIQSAIAYTKSKYCYYIVYDDRSGCIRLFC